MRWCRVRTPSSPRTAAGSSRPSASGTSPTTACATTSSPTSASAEGIIAGWTPPMKLATWNINSLGVRLPQVLQWLAAARPDVLALQELKLTDDKFPLAQLQEAGYHAVFHGQKTYNGVALLSLQPLRAVVKNIPGFDDEHA